MAHALPWKTAWITGASSGIGRDVALILARAGVRVAATARGSDRLTDLAARQPGITAYPVDVTDPSAVRTTTGHILADLGAIDLAFLNAGIWQPMGASDFDAARARQSMAVNYLGIVNALEPLIPPMVARGKGQIALMGSVAGYRGLPGSAAYSPSKSAVISLAETLKPDLQRKGVTISIVNPGFVATPMTNDNPFPMPFILESDDAARRIVDGLAKGKFEVAFPWQMVSLLKVARVLPYMLYFRYMRRLIGDGRR